MKMTMKLVLVGIVVGLLSTAQAVNNSNDIGFLRGGSNDEKVEQFDCTLNGGQDQGTCDGTKSENDTGCVWCSVSSYGVCVSEDIAELIKEKIPGITCDDDTKNDDDSNSADDDKAPSPPATDDDATPSDDSTPSDYWECLMTYKTSDTCATAGCTWCDTKGGYGLCMDAKAAGTASKEDWFTCKITSSNNLEEDANEDKEAEGIISDPNDPTCAVATMSGSESTCKTTMDADGKACEWCSFNGFDFCANNDQAQIAEQVGASCNEDKGIDVDIDDLSDPNDPTCAVATMSGSASTCKTTMDADGKACEWCSFNGFDFCANNDQAQIVEQVGASCDEDSGIDVDNNDVDDIKDLSDPNDPTCAVATMSGSASTCKTTMDADGKACEWCSFNGFDFCANDDQAQIAEQIGASCDEDNGIDVDIDDLSDPNDPTCAVATMSGSASTCKTTMDADGKACEWCSFNGFDFCANNDQAQIVEQVGASCDEDSGIDVDNNDVDDIKDLSDPNDPTCAVATMSGSASTCKTTMDADGKACEWCSFNGFDFCANDDQAQIAEQIGASCDEDNGIDVDIDDLSDPNDPTCAVATMSGSESTCKTTMDADGKACEWCSFNGFDFCANDDQAQIAEQIGASCNEDNGIDIDDKDALITTSTK